MAVNPSRYVRIDSDEAQKQTLAELYAKLALLQEQIDDLKSELATVGNDITGINNEITAVQNEIGNVQQQIYALETSLTGKADKMQLVSANTTLTSLAANTYYVFSAPVVSLNIATVETSLDEIVLQFTAEDGVSISFPASLSWVGEPSFEAGKTYLISIVNNIAVAAEVTA